MDNAVKAVESTMKFRGYRATRIFFELKSPSKRPEGPVTFTPSFFQRIEKVKNDDYVLILSVDIGKDEVNLPFIASVEMEGRFELNNIDNPEEVMRINATAILFPYLRSALTQLTATANIRPVILPTINLAQTFESCNKPISDKE